MSEIIERIKQSAFVSWLLALVKRETAPASPSAPQEAPAVANPAKPLIEEEEAQAPDKPENQKRRPNLRQILDDLDNTWDNLARATKSIEDLPALRNREISGLKRLGPLVLSEQMPDEVAAFDPAFEKLPTTMFVATNDGGQTKDDNLAPDFIYAIKIKKAPWMVAKRSGRPYMMGMGWRTSKGSLMWGTVYAYVDGGKIYPAHWLCDSSVSVPGGSYSKKTWEVASWRREQPSKVVEVVFSQLIAAYQKRFDKWNVSVNKGGRRATFLIDKKDTAYAFKDRTGTALAKDGKRKRIIHFVRSHEQNRADGSVVHVPEHIRGIRDFTWNAYKCFVTSPQHHTFLSASLDLPADDCNIADDESMPEGTLDLHQLADRLVNNEDVNNRRRKKAA